MSMGQNKDSPHPSNLDQPDSATSTTSSPQPGFTIPYMSNMSAPNDYQYPAPPGHQGPAEPYRASPTSSAQNALNLPPMRLPPQQQEAAQQQAPPAIAQMTAPRVPDHGITYWGNSGDQREAHMGIAPSTTVPPPIGYHAPRDLKMMSGGRHKKEIKRRTKTGCLTCRKRRIKCDEAHPVCRNCQKSKRECAGYDPVSYKIQLQPGPTAIQPAPSSNSPISQFPATSSPFTPTPYAPTLSTGNSSPGSSVEPYDYNSAIDPALDGIGAAPMSGPSNFENGSGFRPDVKAGPQNGSAPTSGLSNSQSVDDNNLLTRLTAYVNSPQFKSVNLTELLNSLPKLAQLSASQQMTFSEQDMESLKDNFVKEYATHLNEFFSTKWYTEFGTKVLMSDKALTHDALILFKVMGPTNWRMPAAEAEEIRLILRFMKLCTASNIPEGGVQEAHEVAKRIEVFEHLIAGQRLASNITAYTPTQGVELQSPELRKLLFWNYLGHIASADRGTPQSRDELAQIIFSEKMRQLLESLQGRDVLYSIAIVGFDQKSTPEQIHLFNLAKRQIESTAKSVTEQTNPVATRICALAVKCFTAMHTGDSVPSNGTADSAALEKKA